jgi:multidrug efflux system membrane fusion protein
MHVRRTLPGWILAAAAAAVLLSACGEAPISGSGSRPVLVARAGDAAEAVESAFPGEVRARAESPLAFRIGGNLVRRHVDAGDAVRQGQVLAELDPGDQQLQASAAQAQLAAAEAELGRARADRARYATLARDRLVSASTMDAQEAAWKAADEQARAARAQFEVARNQAGYSQLRAPRDGVIASRQAEAGQVVAAGQAVFTLAGDDGREVSIALPESHIRDFAIGQAAEVELWSAPGRRLPGTLREIAAAADPQTRTYAARVALRAGDADQVELGQSARVYIRDAVDAAALNVPLAALQLGPGGGHAVWVVEPGTSTLRSVPVRLGAFGERHVTVLSGLAPDDWVVVAGGHLLREGEAVAPVDRDNRPVALAGATSERAQ